MKKVTIIGGGFADI